MLKKISLLLLIISFLFGGAQGLSAVNNYSNDYNPSVSLISLSAYENNINWETKGYSKNGFKVVWSKNSNPTYPTRSGDKYNYFSDPNKKEASLEAFSGDGIYYVRVCEYLNGKCGVYSNEIKLSLGDTQKPCTKEYMPVCGEKGKEKITYSNKCLLENSGASFLYEGKCSAPEKNVTDIKIKNDGTKIIWEVDGYSEKGFKVVWSKNQEPSYPTRSGDKYSYHSDPSSYYSKVTPFDGFGKYYIRVCEYLGNGTCNTYSNQITIEFEPVACTMEYAPVCGEDGKTYSNKCVAESVGVTKAYYGECKKDDQIIKIEERADLLSNSDLDSILSEIKQLRNQLKEQENEIKYLKGLVSELNSVSEKMQSAINSFITYGVDENTLKLGEGERAAVVYSFKNTFHRLPQNEDDITDIIKIANGRWPNARSEEAEKIAKENFYRIYLREANMENQNDNAAITIMSYGLRQRAENRSLESEKKAIKIYNNIFKKYPKTTEDWNVLQAITYSGSKR